jgi:ribosome biogenesis GTPase A
MQPSELARFASDFARALTPLAGELGKASTRLSAARTPLPFDAPALGAGLTALGAELEILLERVACERASVFVHGPAKAGKSTLIDALAGTRVAEVSILPGYPCLARSAAGADESATLVRFDGS